MAEIKVEITTTITAANGDAETYSVVRSYYASDNPRFLEDEADKALTKTAEIQRDNLAGRVHSRRGVVGEALQDQPGWSERT